MAREYIDMTPTWEGLLPYLLVIMRDGTFSAQQTARKELTRMAKLADLYVESQKLEAA